MTTAGSSSIAAQVGAIARRDLVLQLAYPVQLALRLGQVVFTSLVMYFVAKLVQTPQALSPYDGDYFAFAITGMVMMSFATLGLTTFSGTITAEQTSGSLEALLVTPTRLSVLLTGAFVVPLGFTILNVVLHLVFAVVLGMHFSAVGLLLGLPALALTALTFCAIGIFAAAFIVLAKRGEPFSVIVIEITTLLAGSVFPVDLLPDVLQPLVRLIPVFWGLEAVRGVMLRGEGFVDTLPNLVALAAFAAVLLPLALWTFGRALHLARVAGTLANA